MIGYHLVGFWGVQREIVITTVLGYFLMYGKSNYFPPSWPILMIQRSRIILSYVYNISGWVRSWLGNIWQVVFGIKESWLAGIIRGYTINKEGSWGGTKRQLFQLFWAFLESLHQKEWENGRGAGKNWLFGYLGHPTVGDNDAKSSMVWAGLIPMGPWWISDTVATRA